MTWYQAPERRVQRGDTEGRGIFPSGCSYSGPCVYSGSEETVAASPQHLDDEHVERWQRFNQVFTVPGIGWLIYILVGQEGVGLATS